MNNSQLDRLLKRVHKLTQLVKKANTRERRLRNSKSDIAYSRAYDELRTASLNLLDTLHRFAEKID